MSIFNCKTISKTQNISLASESTRKVKNNYLNDYINAVLNKEMVCLSLKKVRYIIVNDLNISMNNLSTQMKYVLCDSLCYYIKNWPGWTQCPSVNADKLTLADYYEKFKDYLTSKLEYIIENESKFNLEDVQDSSKVSDIVPTTPSNEENKPEAPYNIVIAGEPIFLNNIGFFEEEGNVIIKQHVGRPWVCLDIRQFLNYPFVRVSIKLPDIELTRSNSHQFIRYICESKDILNVPETNFIDFVRKNNLDCGVKVYSVDYINAYWNQFIKLMKKQTWVNKSKIIELEMIFKQFLYDIQESNLEACILASGKIVNTMATNTSVCFNIGRRTYVRNKTASFNSNNKQNINGVDFCEILIPKMTYTLSSFTAEEDNNTDEVRFKSLDDLNIKFNKTVQERLRFNEIINNCIMYECSLCSLICTGDQAYNNLFEHFKLAHKGEQAVMCYQCRKDFAIAHLAGSRWAHNCTKTTEDIERSKLSARNLQDINKIVEEKLNNCYNPLANYTNRVSECLNSLNIENITLHCEEDIHAHSDVATVSTALNHSPAVGNKSVYPVLNLQPINAISAQSLTGNVSDGAVIDLTQLVSELLRT